MSSDGFEYPTGSQLYLCWNDHMKNISQDFMEQLVSESMVDVTISCEGKYIKAHKMILSACSPYFHDIFTTHSVSHPFIIMNDVRFSDMRLVIEFMYCGEIKVSEDDFRNVLVLAQSLQIKGLSSIKDIYDVHRFTCSAHENVETLYESDVSEVKPENLYARDCLHERKRRRLNAAPTVQNEPIPDEEDLKDIKMEPPDGGVPCETFIVEDSSSSEMKGGNELQSRLLNQAILGEGCYNLKNGSGFQDGEGSLNVAAGTKRGRQLQEFPKKISGDLAMSNDYVNSLGSPATGAVRIRRPPNAFMIFANQWRRKLAKVYEYESNAEISRRLGDMWKSLKKKDKDAYFNAAKLADLEHKEKYPGYYYSPQEARLRKRNRLSEKKSPSKAPPPPPPPRQQSPLRFAKVFMTDENNASIPVMIALSNPEVSEWVRKTLKRKQKVEDDATKKVAKKKKERDRVEGKTKSKANAGVASAKSAEKRK